MFHKKKGFTLVELIVSISIMSIVIVLAIPSIGAITERNSKKRYQNYAKTLLSSAKLYTDSYNIDMFGYEKDGCYQINFSQMEEKKLAKDIDYKEVTCADKEEKKTYVLVKKLDGNIKYQLSIRCVDESNKEEVYRELIDDASAICAGTKSYEGPKISVSPESTNGYLSENETYKVSITVSDVDGLLENNEVEYFWCSDSNCNNVVTSGRIKYENKRETPSASRKVKRPKGDGVYYLKVRPVKVVDVFNNGITQETKVYGPYKFDTTPPVVTVVAYRRSGSGSKEGTAVGQATLGTKQLLADKKYKITGSLGSNYSNNYSGWLNKTNYPNGIYYEITYNDNVEVETESWKENKTGHKSATAAAKVLDGRTGSRNLKSKSGTVGEYFKDDGYRKGQILVTDIAGNYVTVDLDAYLDLTLPTKPVISNPTNGNWTNRDFSLTLTSTDAMSGIKKYQFAYANKVWNDYANSSSTSFVTTPFSQERNENTYIRSMDVAGNYSQESSTPIRIDKVAPRCTTSTTNPSGWTNANVTVTKGCADDQGAFNSQCTLTTHETKVISSNATTYTFGGYTIRDVAGNTRTCPAATVNVYVDKIAPSCGVIIVALELVMDNIQQ